MCRHVVEDGRAAVCRALELSEGDRGRDARPPDVALRLEAKARRVEREVVLTHGRPKVAVLLDVVQPLPGRLGQRHSYSPKR